MHVADPDEVESADSRPLSSWAPADGGDCARQHIAGGEQAAVAVPDLQQDTGQLLQPSAEYLLMPVLSAQHW